MTTSEKFYLRHKNILKGYVKVPSYYSYNHMPLWHKWILYLDEIHKITRFICQYSKIQKISKMLNTFGPKHVISEMFNL